ncbi:GAF domain-containing protein [Sphingomonas qomolangmaensis]|uniref:Response regulator n=1 Tax=Sphingomonas qomolangmaensis TaxID=2918765 RepID=A0ABY5LBD8_9SPHN|nr:GAF domain-containing protein [Sphingomonas qomolangmaensis]UUL83261.1 response regulator [Sphingomonas qomolangmaensis]
MLETAFEESPDFQVVGVASDAQTAYDLICRVGPDLITIDLCMPYIDGAALLKMLEKVRGTKIIVSDQLAKSVLMQSRLEALGASACFGTREVIDDRRGFFTKLHAVCDRAEAFRQAQQRVAIQAPTNMDAASVATAASAGPAPGFPVPRDEAARLAILHRKQLANATAERQFDLITRYVAEILGFPVCLITFIDRDTQWLKSAYGFQELHMPRCDAFCNYTIVQDGTFIVTNAANDRRFAQTRLVVGEPFVRTYVGHPITLRDGTRIGALCVLDTRQRYIGKPIPTTLAYMADIISEMVETRPVAA